MCVRACVCVRETVKRPSPTQRNQQQEQKIEHLRDLIVEETAVRVQQRSVRELLRHPCHQRLAGERADTQEQGLRIQHRSGNQHKLQRGGRGREKKRKERAVNTTKRMAREGGREGKRRKHTLTFPRGGSA